MAQYREVNLDTIVGLSFESITLENLLYLEGGDPIDVILFNSTCGRKFILYDKPSIPNNPASPDICVKRIGGKFFDILEAPITEVSLQRKDFDESNFPLLANTSVWSYRFCTLTQRVIVEWNADLTKGKIGVDFFEVFE